MKLLLTDRAIRDSRDVSSSCPDYRAIGAAAAATRAPTTISEYAR